MGYSRRDASIQALHWCLDYCTYRLSLGQKMIRIRPHPPHSLSAKRITTPISSLLSLSLSISPAGVLFKEAGPDIRREARGAEVGLMPHSLRHFTVLQAVIKQHYLPVGHNHTPLAPNPTTMTATTSPFTCRGFRGPVDLPQEISEVDIFPWRNGERERPAQRRRRNSQEI